MYSNSGNESVSLYAERMFRLSRDAYSNAELTDPTSYSLAQRQLVNYFIDGLYDKSIKLKLMRRQRKMTGVSEQLYKDKLTQPFTEIYLYTNILDNDY